MPVRPKPLTRRRMTCASWPAWATAFAACRALDAQLYASFSDGQHRVSFDRVVEVMKQTGHDIPSLYKETSRGGLAKGFAE